MVDNVDLSLAMIGKNYYPMDFVKIVQTLKDSKVLEEPVELINVIQHND